MILSQSAKYALRATIYLADHGEGPHLSREIAEALDVPAQYLAKILQDLARHGITVNCVSPGATATPATGNLVEAAASGDEDAKSRLNQMLRVYPIGRGLQRLGMPQDIANATTFLVSDRAEWITGQTLSVSGGYTMV